MDGRRDGRGWLRPSFHLYLLVFTLTGFFAQVPMGVFAAQSPLDSTAHVLLPAAATSLLYDLLYPRVVHSAAQYFATMWLLGVCAEMVWECVEFALDAVFRFGLQVDNTDTMRDIVSGIAGATLGAGLRLWLWMRSRRLDAAERAGEARPRFYYRSAPGTDGSPTYEGLWAAGAVGRWCSDRHSSIAEAERCARDRWWDDRERVKPAVTPAPRRQLFRLPTAVPRPALLRGSVVRPGTRLGLVGAAIVIALVPSAYVGYLAWAAAPIPPAPSAAPSVAIAAAELAPGEPGPAAFDTAVAASVPVPSLGTSVPVGGTPGFVVVSPQGRQAYVANRTAGVITVVDTAVNRVTAVIPVVQGPPQYLAFSPDGRTVYVSIFNETRTIAAIGVLDTTTNSVVATIPVRTRPFLAAVTPDGRRLYVPNHDSGTVSVIDTATRVVTAEIRVAPDPHWIEFSRDGRRAYTANHESNLISVIDTATDTVVAEVPAQRSPHSVAVHPTRPLVAGVNYDSDSVTVLDTDTERVVATIGVGRGPQDITWAPDGRFAYVTNVNDNTVSVVDAVTLSVTATIPTGDSPTSIAVLPNGREAYVTNLHDGTLTVLNTAG